ncbi:hypothetical protein ACNDXX_003645, partial [Escherichia coli]
YIFPEHHSLLPFIKSDCLPDRINKKEARNYVAGMDLSDRERCCMPLLGGKPNRTKMYGKLIYQSVPSSVIRGRDVITPAYFL